MRFERLSLLSICKQKDNAGRFELFLRVPRPGKTVTTLHIHAKLCGNYALPTLSQTSNIERVVVGWQPSTTAEGFPVPLERFGMACPDCLWRFRQGYHLLHCLWLYFFELGSKHVSQCINPPRMVMVNLAPLCTPRTQNTAFPHLLSGLGCLYISMASRPEPKVG